MVQGFVCVDLNANSQPFTTILSTSSALPEDIIRRRIFTMHLLGERRANKPFQFILHQFIIALIIYLSIFGVATQC